jgi:hypothetical protein
VTGYYPTGVELSPSGKYVSSKIRYNIINVGMWLALNSAVLLSKGVPINCNKKMAHWDQVLMIIFRSSAHASSPDDDILSPYSLQ